MAEFKITIADVKSKGQTYQTIVKDAEASKLVGKKIGDKIQGDLFGLSGYEFEITGGSDKQGTPMRKNISGSKRIKLLLKKGVGFHPERKGVRAKKSVLGNTVSEVTAQINTKVITYGKDDLKAKFGKEPKAEGQQ
ncbi:MAG: 30S ribosomal protein S6e [Candidatus Nanoarchaeia archaeon]|nr:30S ribosomal protein S6e [Candidatus Nanoarchaeia archaeon]